MEMNCSSSTSRFPGLGIVLFHSQILKDSRLRYQVQVAEKPIIICWWIFGTHPNFSPWFAERLVFLPTTRGKRQYWLCSRNLLIQYKNIHLVRLRKKYRRKQVERCEGGKSPAVYTVLPQAGMNPAHTSYIPFPLQPASQHSLGYWRGPIRVLVKNEDSETVGKDVMDFRLPSGYFITILITNTLRGHRCKRI